MGVGPRGTLFANMLSLCCAEAVLTELITPTEHDPDAALGGRLTDGIEAAARKLGLGWRAHRFGACTRIILVPEVRLVFLPFAWRQKETVLDPTTTAVSAA